MDANTTAHVQSCLERLRAGDQAAQEALLAGTCERLRQLASMMLGGYSRLRRWEETDDVLIKSMMRLNLALSASTPESPRHFFRLAALQIRRELKDMVRHYYGQYGIGSKHVSSEGAKHAGQPRSQGADLPANAADETHDPAKLAEWTELHEKVESLPDEQREVFELVWYHQITQGEVAELLDVSRRTVIRRWQAACLQLHQQLFNPDILSQPAGNSRREGN